MSNDDTYKKGKKYLTSAMTYERLQSTKEGKTYSYRGHSEQAELDTGLLIRPIGLWAEE